ncbi:hypothetical protein A2U01_0068933, partial [Trifolium medium]|nr:hypothetical protein [Trifolium medium]
FGKRMATVLAQWNHPNMEGAGGQILGAIFHS